MEGVTLTPEIFGNKQGATSTPEIFSNKHTGHLIGCDKKSEIVQYFQGRLCDKIGLLCDKYAIFSGLIYIALPGFKGEKPL